MMCSGPQGRHGFGGDLESGRRLFRARGESGGPGHQLARSDDVVVSSELRTTVERDEQGTYSFEDLGALTAPGFEAPIHLHTLRRQRSRS